MEGKTMDSIDYAKLLVTKYGVDLGEALKAIDAEVDDLRHDPFHDCKPSGLLWAWR